MNTVKLSRREAMPLIGESFPDYCGRKIRLVPVESVMFCDTNWGGGTRNEYRALNLHTGKRAAFTAPAPWANVVEGSRVAIPPGCIVICHSIFCGTDCGISIYCNPADMPRLIASGRVWRND